MKEIKSIISAFDKACREGKKSALATVVHVEGSSYRRPGARMLITEQGELTGSISGGCLEGDALRKALLVINSSRSMLVTYDTSDEDDAKLGLGLGCQGIIQVLIEPLQEERGREIMELLREAVAKRKNSVLITIFSLQNKKEQQAGTCFYFDEDSNQKGQAPFLHKELLQESKQVLREGKLSFTKYDFDGKEFIAFTELIQPVPVLVIAGAGNDVVPLVAMADTIGWETIVADGRPLYAKKERFPVASCQVLLAKPGDVLKEIDIDNRTAFVLMTHNYNYDLSMLRALLIEDIFYIGVLGPKKKMQMLLDELRSGGLELDDEKLSRIHGPVGLNIGAETAEEIALSILAEIKSVLSSSEPARLRDLNETIHSRSDLTIKETSSKKLKEGIK